jgi:phosphoglycolate phosphatase
MVYALETLGVSPPSEDVLRSMVGPPIRDNFARILGDDKPELIAEGIQLYRKRIEEQGIAESTLYGGVAQLLLDLSKQYDLYVATARIQHLTDLMLSHFLIDHHFAAAYGSSPSGEFNDKADLIQHMLAQHQLDSTQCMMIGDRNYDIAAAKSNSMRSIGVTYGYGSLEELQSAGADFIVGSVEELSQLLL